MNKGVEVQYTITQWEGTPKLVYVIITPKSSTFIARQAGLLSTRGENSINFYFTMVPLRKNIKVPAKGSGLEQNISQNKSQESSCHFGLEVGPSLGFRVSGLRFRV